MYYRMAPFSFSSRVFFLHAGVIGEERVISRYDPASDICLCVRVYTCTDLHRYDRSDPNSAEVHIWHKHIDNVLELFDPLRRIGVS